MMSAEAVASGGTIAAGGLVATLQSIGVVGLSVGGTAAAAGTGATLGSAVGGGTAAAVRCGSGSSSHVAASGIGGLDAPGTWTVVVEEWFGIGCCTHQFESSTEACKFFDEKRRCARILVNPVGKEVAHGVFIADLNGALERVRRHWRQARAAGRGGT
ncbi:unnamed protein product [Polarella glacialis]|nr:unnamed protein product [Polarella glacialis]